jgi:hypothetical protein
VTTITFSDVKGGFYGRGNINADPFFVDADGADNIFGTEDDNLRLLPGSPCTDRGDNSAVPPSVTEDLDGNPRIMDGTVDMGAYEGGIARRPSIHYVDAVNGNNRNDGASLNRAFATIQKGIDSAEDGDFVLVYPGLYTEEIHFVGKPMTVQGAATADGVPVLQNPGDFAVLLYLGEGSDTVIKNFVIKNSFMAIFIADSSPTISNVTVVDNKYGIEAYAGAEPDIASSIFWNNTDSDLFQCQARYSCVERASEGQGNTDADPLFADPDDGDYHLRSERGRYWPEHDVWVLDEVTSPCIDAGDPDADSSAEPVPNGGRINMGAYGGTAHASMSKLWMLGADVNHDGVVDMTDLAMLVESWLECGHEPGSNQPPEVNITLPPDGAVFNSYEEIQIEAAARDVDGFVVGVQFFANGDKIGEDTDFSGGWTSDGSDLPPGEYRLVALATDNGGAIAASTAVVIEISESPHLPPRR